MNNNLTFTRIQNHDQKAFKKLFDSLYSDLVNYANVYLLDSSDSEDLVQEIFIYLWINAREIHIRNSIKAYLFATVRNHCINHLKKLKITDNTLTIDVLSNFSYDEILDSHNTEEQRIIQRRILEVIDNLPEKMKLIVKLKFIDNYKYKEIAEELDISVNTVKTQLKRAKARISQTLLLITIFLINIK